jgi:Mlc titration factor MtfA (ptsG expression regulator)
MLGHLWRQWQQQREQAALRRRAIPDDLWKRTLVRYPFLQRHDAEAAAELRRLTSLFLDRKEFSAAGGLHLTDAMVVAIAAQAVLPVLRLGLPRYDGFVGIVVHPAAVMAQREEPDADGVVHAFDEALTGEAVQGGPVMLSWHDVRTAGQHAAQGYNVVIHEFAHVLDMADGVADGVPLLPPDLPPGEWQATLQDEYTRFVQRVEAGDDTVLDPYGAEAEEEFFAVASESFFVNPGPMQQEHPALYRMLQRFYGQDPLAETPARRRS